MIDSRFLPWLQTNRSHSGLLGLSIQVPGEAALVQVCAEGVSQAALEHAWRCVSETFPVLQLNELPTGGFRFVFGEAYLHCERRKDGACIGICAPRDEQLFSRDQLEQLLTEFHEL